MEILATFHCPVLSFCNYIGWTDWFEGFDFVFLFVFCNLVEKWPFWTKELSAGKSTVERCEAHNEEDIVLG